VAIDLQAKAGQQIWCARVRNGSLVFVERFIERLPSVPEATILEGTSRFSKNICCVAGAVLTRLIKLVKNNMQGTFTSNS
jgi:hypothetical protein